MAVLPSPQSTHKFYQADGVTPAAAYEVYTYAAGTTTPLASYSDAAGLSANTNPIILNSNGEASIYITAGVSYDIVLKYPGGGAQIGPTQRVIVDSDTTLRGELASSSGSSLVTFLQSGTGAVSRTVQAKLREWVSVKDFGATGDGVTDDTAAIQLALTAVRVAGGGACYLPPGTYIYSQSLLVGSNTRFYGDGDASILKAKQVGYVGVNTGTDSTTNCQAIRNYNHAASSLTDSDIIIENITIDWGSVTISGGGAHCVSMRYVDRPKAINVRGINGENVTAFRACRDSIVDSCHGTNQINCFFDHWEPSGNCIVRNSTGRSPGVYIAQGIQFNDTGDGTNTTALDFLVEGCELYRVRGATGQSTAIAIGALDAAGIVRRCRTIGNYIEDADNGITFAGGGGQHMSIGDTLRNVDQLPIFLQQNTASPSACRVINPHLIDCDHAPVNQALIVFNGDRNEVRGLKVTNSSSPAYACLGWFTSVATNSVLSIDQAETGSSVRVINNGTNCTVVDQLNSYEEGTFTPELKFGGANVGMAYSVQAGKYTRVGRQVAIAVRINLSAVGSSTGGVTITGLPYTAESAGNAIYGAAVCSFSGTSGTNTSLGAFVNGNTIVLRNGSTSTQLVETNITASFTILVTAVYNV